MGNRGVRRFGRFRHVPLALCVLAASADLIAAAAPATAALALDAAVPLAFALVVVAGYFYGMTIGMTSALVVALGDACATAWSPGAVERGGTHTAIAFSLYALQVVVGGMIGRLRELADRGEQDGSERRIAESRIAELSTHDALTGLPNRTTLCARLEESLDPLRPDGVVALLFVDLDRFKDVNDALGHLWGDALLREVAARLRTLVREGDVVARLGNDEFAVLLPGRDARRARRVAERIVTALERPFPLAGQTLVVSASVGIAYAAPDTDAATLLRHADAAMYAAKRQRNGVGIYSASEGAPAAQRLSMSGDLRAAVARNELVLHFQPQIDVATRAVRGVEALVRWQHPQRGLLFPDAFIPVAEEIGMMSHITEWVLQAAIAQAARWNAGGLPLRMAVNLSAHDLRDDRVGATIARLLARHELSAQQLCLELTESTVTAEAAFAAERLRLLSRSGIRISIDDFGTGYSSLALLKAFPVDELKIDKQFVMGMAQDADDAAIVFSTIELAHRLGVDVVVEGVEHDTTLEAIARLGAELAQGFAISKALPAPAFEAWLRAYRELPVKS